MQLGTAPSSTTPLGWRAATPVYAPRCAEATVLHRVLSRHLGPFLEQSRNDESLTLALSFVDSLRAVDRAYAAARRFVPRAFLQAVGRDNVVDVQRGDSVALRMTVLFADIRGFTTLLEGRSPEQSFALVNRYHAAIEPCIRDRGGFIHQYLGDGIVALFDGPVDDAVAAGVAMQHTVRGLRADGVDIQIGVGLHRGEVMLGTIGGQEQLTTGVISDVVNLAARIEGMTKVYGARLMVTDAVADELAEEHPFRLRELDRVRAKGRSGITVIHQVLDAEDEETQADRLERADGWRDALERYRLGDFEGAVPLLEAFDDPAGHLLAARARRFLEQGTPPEDWDGVTDLTTK